MKPYIVVVGASAGGVEALSNFLPAISEKSNLVIFIVLHIKPLESALEQVLAAKSKLPVTTVTTKIAYKPRNIYVCPPNHHMRIDSKYVEVSVGAKINGFRPSIEPLFTSAAQSCQKRVILVLLSGLLYDGVLGVQAVKRNGGATIVQHPREAKFPELPFNALKSGYVDFALPVEQIADKLNELCSNLKYKEAPMSKSVDNLFEDITELAVQGKQTLPIILNKLGAPSDLTCPECSGTLWEIKKDQEVHFRCRVGHQYNINNIEHMHSKTVENILWAAVRALEESGAIAQRVAEQLQKSQLDAALSLYEKKAEYAFESAKKLRGLVDKIIKNLSI